MAGIIDCQSTVGCDSWHREMAGRASITVTKTKASRTIMMASIRTGSLQATFHEANSVPQSFEHALEWKQRRPNTKR
jgi:hypothetical protein